MVLTEAIGLLCVLTGAYALARPQSVRTYPTATQWESDPDDAKQEQRAYAAMMAFFLIVSGIGLILLGLLGSAP